MRSPPRTPSLLLLALLLAPTGACLLFDEEPCADPTEPGCTPAEIVPGPVICNREGDERCLDGTVCRFDFTAPCSGDTACPLYCLPALPERPTCTAEIDEPCRHGNGHPCELDDDCLTGVCLELVPGSRTCLQPCHATTASPSGGCRVGFVCEAGVPLPAGGTVDACGGGTVPCSSDRACEELGLGRCLVKNGLQLKDGLAAAICSLDEGEDDTGRNCSHPDELHPHSHSDLCPVRGLCFRACRNNDAEGCNQGICTRPCEKDADCPDRLFCLPFSDRDLQAFFPGNAPQFKICRLQDSNVDYEWGCKDDVDCCSGLHTATVPWGPPDPPPPELTFPVEFDYQEQGAEDLVCCLKTTQNLCQPYPAPFSVESHCSLVATAGGPDDQPPPRLSTQCRSNHERTPALALPGDPCTDGSECLTHLCAGGRCTTPCYTEPWPSSPDRDPTCPALPDGTARVCCPGRVPFFDTAGVTRSCAAGEPCPAGTACWEGSCQVCIATCQLGAECPAGGDPSCAGPL